MTTYLLHPYNSRVEANDPGVIPLLKDCLRSNRHDTIRFAALSIGKLAKNYKDLCNKTVAELIDALSSDNPQIRKCVLSTLTLLDIPLCYTGAITKIEKGDNKLYNQALAKKLIKDIISKTSSEDIDKRYKNHSSNFPVNNDNAKNLVGSNFSIEPKECKVLHDEGAFDDKLPDILTNPLSHDEINEFIESDYFNDKSQNALAQEPDEDNEVFSSANPGKINNCLVAIDDDSNEILTIDHHYNQILQSYDPVELIPSETYDHWRTALVATPYANQTMIELAEEINLSWPYTRQGEKLSEYLGYDINSIRTIPTFGKKKSRTLILCVTHAIYKSDRIEFAWNKPVENVPNEPQQNALTFKELLHSYRPTGKISGDLWETWCRRINSTPATSMKIAEIAARYQLDWPYSKRYILVSEYSNLSLRTLLNLPGYGKRKIRSLILCIASLALNPISIEDPLTSDHHSDLEPSISEKIGFEDIYSSVRDELAKLSVREQVIAKRRYGIDGEKASTLEEIAVEIGVTRERVRQILIKVVERLKTSQVGKQLPKLISNLNIDELWGNLANQHGAISKIDVNRAFEKQIQGEFVLALECCGMNVSAWLSSIATEGTHAWYRSSCELEGFLQKLEDLVLNADMPLPISTIGQHLGISAQDAGTVICLSADYKIFNGYVFQGRIGPRARRTAHLHKLLSSVGSFLPLYDLTAIHNKAYPNEICTTRDADIVMREAPHLFVSLGDRGWCSIGSYKTEDLEHSDLSKPCYDNETLLDSSEPRDEVSVTSIIKGILRDRGLSNFTDIVTDFMNITDNAYSEHSVGPMLLTRDEFVKFAPSVYGLRENSNGFGPSTSDLLLNEADCQLYTMARYAGEDFRSFPLWTPAMECKWCMWAERLDNVELRESLFNIAFPDEWPLYDKLIKEWKDKIAQNGHSYHLLREPKYNDSTLPDIRSIYALVRYAKDHDSINWISANRVLGRRLDDYHTAVRRWCCTTHKASQMATIVSALRGSSPGVLTFDGVRSSESARRAAYSRVTHKHKIKGEILASPMKEWLNIHIWLYLIVRRIDFNKGYRFGFRRVGCLPCPFNSRWSSVLTKHIYPNDHEKWTQFLLNHAVSIKHPNPENFAEDGWRTRAGGRGMNSEVTKLDKEVCEVQDRTFTYTLAIPWSESFLEFLKPFGDLQISHDDGVVIKGMIKVDIDFYINARKNFTLRQWRELLIRSMGYNPSVYTQNEQMHLLTRLAPLIQQSINLIELAPKGTGKSYVYSRLSRHAWLISGGVVTRAQLFYNMGSKTAGVVTRFDTVVLDEIQTIKFSDEGELVGAMKGYLEQGEFRVMQYKGSSDAGFVLLANIPLNEDSTPKEIDLFRGLPSWLQGQTSTALIDRFHGIIPGWEIRKINKECLCDGMALKADYFGEIFHALRARTEYMQYVKDNTRSNGNLRDINAVERLAAAFLKLLFPDLSTALPEQFREHCLNPAKELRKRIRKQLAISDLEYSPELAEIEVHL